MVSRLLIQIFFRQNFAGLYAQIQVPFFFSLFQKEMELVSSICAFLGAKNRPLRTYASLRAYIYRSVHCLGWIEILALHIKTTILGV